MADPVEDILRRHVAALIALGVKRKAIADHVDRHQAWITRWLDGSGELSVKQLQRLIAYVGRMSEAIDQIERYGPMPFLDNKDKPPETPEKVPPNRGRPSAKKRRAG